MADSSARIPAGRYIFERIAQLGIRHVFGVPGDFNLFLLDELYKVPQLKWQGTCNELNAAYAADGYARIRGLPGVLVTTYAVGELSALNGVAGAYAEHAGMIHIVGMTSRHQQRDRVMVHHTFKKNQDHLTYVKMEEPINKTQAILLNDATMADEIDRVIVECVKSRLPVTIYIPMDGVSVPLDATRLQTPLDITIKNDPHIEDRLVARILEEIKKATNPSILADVLAIRHGGRDLTRKLADLTQYSSYTTQLSKGIIDEDSPFFAGVYNGQVSFPETRAALEASDLVLNVGPLLSDSNTGAWTRNIPDEKLVILGHDFCSVHKERFEDIHFLPVLEKIIQELEKQPGTYGLPRKGKRIETPVLNDSTSGEIKQSYIWQRIGKFVQPGDIVLAEAGTAQFGMPDAVFPSNVSYITQIYWSSIGFTVGACLGACVAARETDPKRRVILLVGEGSLQMTVQEVGTYIRYGYTPLIFVINNNGYSIERAIHGPEQEYNDVSMLWDHQRLLEFLGAREETNIKGRSFSCKTVEELEKVLTDQEFAKADHIQLCEIFMDTFDYPWRLSEQLVIVRKRAADQANAKITNLQS